MRKVLFLFAIILAASLCYAPAQAGTLNWTGCGITKKAFMKELAAAYKAKTGTTIVLTGGGATKGIRDTAAGKSDMGGSCRRKIDVPEEKDAYLIQVAWDALVVVVNKDHPVDNITTKQLKDLLMGNITNWKELGGNDAPLKLYIRKGKIRGVGLMLREVLFGDPDMDFTNKSIVMKSSGPLEAAISKDLSGIGVTGVSSAKKRVMLKMLKLDGIAPTKENIESVKYTLFRPLYLVTKGKPKGEVKKFIDFALSKEGQAIISSQGTVSLVDGKLLKAKYKY